MSLNHIVKNGLKDLSLDVINVDCVKLNAGSINLDGNDLPSFNQSLNTTDDVEFNKITLGATIFTDPQQVVNKAYVDNSSPGLGSLQVAYDGGNTILTQAGFPIEILGQEGITVTKTNFANDQDLVTKKFVDDSISSIPQPNTTLQDAYNNGSGEIALSTSKPLNITGNEGINVNANSITTAKLTFNNSQELVSKKFVDDSISSIPQPNTTLQDAYDNGSGEIFLALGKPLSFTGDSTVNVNNNPVLSSKLTFNDSQEFITKQYVDDNIPPSVNVFQGATEIADGTSGLIPAPIAGQSTYKLYGDGSWRKPKVIRFSRNTTSGSLNNGDFAVWENVDINTGFTIVNGNTVILPSFGLYEVQLGMRIGAVVADSFADWGIVNVSNPSSYFAQLRLLSNNTNSNFGTLTSTTCFIDTSSTGPIIIAPVLIQHTQSEIEQSYWTIKEI
jgi:hypothetical protein